MPRQVDPAEIDLQTERAIALRRLAEYPEWEVLRQVAEEDREKSEKAIYRQFTGHKGRNGKVGMPPPIDQRVIDKRMGFWEGVFTVLNAPDRIVKRAEQMLETVNDAQQEGAE